MTHTIELPNGRKIGDGQPCFIVGEVGQNHQGDVYTALRTIKACHEAGVDAIKLTKRHVPSDMTRAMRCQPYDNPNSFGANYGEHREQLELPIKDYVHLKERMAYNKWFEVLFATACDVASVKELDTYLDPPMYKVASRDIDNLPLLAVIARTGKPVILSTGMLTNDSAILGRAIRMIRRVGLHNDIIVLACRSIYPTPYELCDLSRLKTIRDEFDVLVGMSDHTIGIMIPIAALALGACMIEKHVTLSRAMKGTDHACSLEPDGIQRVVRDIRNLEAAMQPADMKTLYGRLLPARQKLGRSLVTTCDIAPGEVICPHHLTVKSPGTGIPYSGKDSLLGKVARIAIPADTTIQLTDVMELVETVEREHA
jgi:sialic acid synthase SpsE